MVGLEKARGVGERGGAAERVRSVHAYQQPSKVDAWILLSILVPGGGMLVFALYHLAIFGLFHPATWIILLSTLGYALVIFGLAYPVTYRIEAGYLVIHSGWVRMRLALADVVAVRPSRNPLSAPAWSLDRLRVDYRTGKKAGMLLISPRDRNAFLCVLEQAIEESGGKL